MEGEREGERDGWKEREMDGREGGSEREEAVLT